MGKNSSKTNIRQLKFMCITFNSALRTKMAVKALAAGGFSVLITLNTLKICSPLKIEKNSSLVNFTHFPEKTHLFELELIFVSLSWRSLHAYKILYLK